MANIVKEAAKSGRRIRGVHLTFPAPTVIELLASAHIDFVYIDGEHGRFDRHDIETTCITSELCGTTVIARVPDIGAATITSFLDRGVKGLVFPHIETVEDAERAISAAYFAPLGQRSFGGGRPSYLAIPDKPAHLRRCNEATSICLMIETETGLAAVSDLARLPGVDYFSFGMMDLAQSLGHPGRPDHEEVDKAVRQATIAIHASGKRVREDFMAYAWINDLVIAGAKQLLVA